MPLILADAAGDCSQTPVLVRFVKVRGFDTVGFKNRPKCIKLLLVANGQVNVRGMMVGRSTEEICVLYGSMCRLNSLLRDRNVAARDCVQVRLGSADLQIFRHDVLTIKCRRFERGVGGSGQMLSGRYHQP